MKIANKELSVIFSDDAIYEYLWRYDAHDRKVKAEEYLSLYRVIKNDLAATKFRLSQADDTVSLCLARQGSSTFEVMSRSEGVNGREIYAASVIQDAEELRGEIIKEQNRLKLQLSLIEASVFILPSENQYKILFDKKNYGSKSSPKPSVAQMVLREKYLTGDKIRSNTEVARIMSTMNKSKFYPLKIKEILDTYLPWIFVPEDFFVDRLYEF